MSQNRGVIATFDQLPPGSPVLNVAKSGTGSGTVTSSPVGITCGSDCRQGYLLGAKVTLTATPGAGTRFDGWAGACSGTSTCALTMDRSLDVTAAFTQVATLQSAKARTTSATARITSRLAVTSPGKITQRATTGSTKLTTWCRVTRPVKSASTASLACTLGPRARQQLRKGPLSVTLRTTFAPKGADAVTVNRVVRIPRAK